MGNHQAKSDGVARKRRQKEHKSPAKGHNPDPEPVVHSPSVVTSDRVTLSPAESAVNHIPLPAEIRHEIYRIALSIPHCLKNDGKSLYPISIRDESGFCFRNPFDLNLLLASKQTYLEAFSLFYRNNTFEFLSLDSVLYFLANIGYARRAHILSISIMSWRSELVCKTALAKIKALPSLEHLRVPYSHHNVHPLLSEIRGLHRIECVRSDPNSDFYSDGHVRDFRDRCIYLMDDIDPVMATQMRRPRLQRYVLDLQKMEPIVRKERLGFYRRDEADRLPRWGQTTRSYIEESRFSPAQVDGVNRGH